MSTEPLAGAIIGHLVGDFVFQNDWLAKNKKTSTAVCALHCFIWTWCVLLFSGWMFLDSRPAVIAAVFLYATHFIQDRTNVIASWMDAIGQNEFRTGPCSPWSGIVVDNVWHLVAIWLA